jgi:coenzyme PQQ synthesis protein D (PqqD)
MTDRPVRSEGLEINPVPDGYVVYDEHCDLVHYLNHTAAIVLELCTGQQTAAEITAALAEAFPAAPEIPAAVTNCIEHLRGLGLIQPAAAAVP